MRGELSNKMSAAFYSCLQFLRILALVFSACSHAAADMPLSLIGIQDFLDLSIELGVNGPEAFRDIFMYRRFGYSEAFGCGAHCRLMFYDILAQNDRTLI